MPASRCRERESEREESIGKDRERAGTEADRRRDKETSRSERRHEVERSTYCDLVDLERPAAVGVDACI